MNMRSVYIHVVVIMSIVMVGVSPACAFISGNSSFIEICAADGSIQKIEVDAAMDPYSEPAPIPADHLEAMEQCPFCFAASNQQYGEAQSQVIAGVVSSGYLAVSSGMAVPLGASRTLYQPRGPPTLS